MNTNNIPKENQLSSTGFVKTLNDDAIMFAAGNFPETMPASEWYKRFIAYLSSLPPTGEVLAEKMEVLKEFCKEYNHFYNYPYKEQGAKIKTFDEWVSEPKIAALLQSLFSPAQPTERFGNFTGEEIGTISYNPATNDFRIEPYPDEPNQEAIRGLQGEANPKELWDKVIEQRPANEPVEPTGEIKTWIEQEAKSVSIDLLGHDARGSVDHIKESFNALYAHLQPRIAELETGLTTAEDMLSANRKERRELEAEVDRLTRCNEGQSRVISKMYADAVEDVKYEQGKKQRIADLFRAYARSRREKIKELETALHQMTLSESTDLSSLIDKVKELDADAKEMQTWLEKVANGQMRISDYDPLRLFLKIRKLNAEADQQNQNT